jgi:hypothetical protein
MTDDELAEAVVDGLEGWEETDFVCSCRNPHPSLWGRLDQPLMCRECGRKVVTHIYRGRDKKGNCFVDIDY